MAEPNVRLLFYYGGYISSEGTRKQYVGGSMKPIDIDTDMVSYIDLRAVVEEELECPQVCEIFHKAPNETMDDGLGSVTCDNTMMQMFAMHKAKNNKYIDLYVHNPLMEHQQTDIPLQIVDDLVDVHVDVHVDVDVDADYDEVEENEVDSDVCDKEWDNSGNEDSDDQFSGFEDSSDDEVEEVIKPGVIVCTEPLVDIMNEEGALSDKSDDIGCLSGEEDEEDGNMSKTLEFDAVKDMANPRLIEGMIFPNVKAFRALLKEFHIREGCEFVYLKNESTRVTVKCKESVSKDGKVFCNFRLHASPITGETSFQIKRLSPDHSCTRKYTNKHATHKWVAGKYMEDLNDEPDKKVKTLKTDVKRKWMLDVSSNKAYRAKKTALRILRGDHEEQYLRLRDYCHMLLKHNPGSSALLKVDRRGEHVMFQRLFICFDAQAKGFLAACRPFIGLDACFLKGPYGGQLMHAVGRDGNNQMYPLCMAVVEAELKDSWIWFLEHLVQIIGRPEDKRLCFMSDRQKGLIEAFNQVMPGVEHRFCLRHMYANFNKTYKGKEMKDMFWGAASAYTEIEFNNKMAEMKAYNQGAYDWLMRENPEVWARAYFKPSSRCVRMDNNMSEGFNTWIKDARDQPIVTMVETIRRQLMTRYVQRLDFSNKFKSHLCPNIAAGIEVKKVNARGMQVIYSGGTVFEVANMERTFVVDIGQHTCTCRKWDLSGVPCVHGCAAILTHKDHPEQYVEDWYTKDTFVRSYSHRINPIPDKSMWPATECEPLLPPPSRIPIGRPKKARRKGEDEPTNPYKVRHHTSVMCRKCGHYGHNKRTCKTPQQSYAAHKAKYYGKQNRMYAGVPPAPKGTADGELVTGTVSARGRGRGRGGRGRGRGSVSQRGRGSVSGRGRGRGRTSGSGSASQDIPTDGSGKRKSIQAPPKEQAPKRLKNVGDGWFSSQPPKRGKTICNVSSSQP